MQAIILVKGATGPNPAYDPTKPVGPENRPDRDIEPGTIIDHPDCWRLCLAGHHLSNDYLAEPHDDECKAKVLPLRAAEEEAKASAETMEAPVQQTTVPETLKAVKSRKPRQDDTQ